MARSRNIKPGFFTNDLLGEMEPLARLLFAGLWTLCDREGRVEDRPKKIKAEVLPYDNCDPEALLQQLTDKGFILRYKAGAIAVIQVLAWDKHQSPHLKEAASALPAPDKHGASTRQTPESTGKAPEQHGKGQDDCQPDPALAHLIPSSLIPDSLSSDTKVPRKQRATSLPASFGISERVRQWASEKGYAHLDAHLEAFLSYVKRKGATYVDWDEALMNAIREDWAKANPKRKVDSLMAGNIAAARRYQEAHGE
jgi:hypothetical protein